MARYIVGDIQGCFQSLQHLLQTAGFVAGQDELCAVGDLVNRGPDSLATLRWAVEQDITCVLGNHDLYLLALAAGVAKPKNHTLHEILAAPDRNILIEWLRHRPLLLIDEEVGLVHAGLAPAWSLHEAQVWSERAEQALAGSDWRGFLKRIFEGADSPLVDAVNCLTRIRMCTADGTPDYRYSGSPEQAPQGLRPWFETSQALNEDRPLYFGHWAALGHRRLAGAIALDGGCVWGNEMVAIRSDDGHVTRIACVDGDQYRPLE